MSISEHVRVSRSRHAAATHGQAVTELALLTPVLALILLAIIEFSGAFQAKMELQSAASQAARIGAIEGKSSTADQDMIAAIKATHGIDPASINQIQIYRAAPDGSVSVDSSTGNPQVNTYNTTSSPPFGSCISSCGWSSSNRNTGEPSDSVGIHIIYMYHPIIALPGFPSITMDDQTVQRLNPTQMDYPCPIPGIPVNVGAAIINPQPSTQDAISWDLIPGATTYHIYASVDGAPYMTTPVYNGPGTTVGSQAQATYDRTTTFTAGDIRRYAPISYEVTGVNSCGEGERSLPVNDGQCPLPAAPANLTVADANTPGNHLLTWTAVPDKPGAYGHYVVTQRVGSNAPNTLPYVNAPTTQVTIPYNDPTYQPITYKIWYVSSCQVDGSYGSSPRVSSVSITPIPQPIMTLSDSDGQTNVHPGDILTYQLRYANTGSPSTAVAKNVKLVDSLDSNVTFSSCTYTAGACSFDSAKNTVTAIPSSGGTVNPGPGAIVQVVVKVNSSAMGTIANSVTMTYTDANSHNPQTAAASDSPVDSVVLPPAMSVSETNTAPSGYKATNSTPYTMLTYTVTFVNTASQPGAIAQSVQVSDVLSAAIVADSATVNAPDTGPLCTLGSTITCNINGMVAPGHTGTITIQAHIKPGTASGTLLNSSVTLKSNDAAGTLQPATTATDNHSAS